MAFSFLVAALMAQSALTVPAGESPGPQGAQWTLIASDEEGDYLIDQRSVRGEGGLVRFRMRQIPKPSRPASFNAAIVAYQVDCVGQTLAIEAIEAFDAAGRLVASRTVPEDWLDKDRIYAGTTEETFFRRVCTSSARARLRDRPPPPPVMIVAPPSPRPVPIAPPAPPPPPPPPPPSPNSAVQRAVPLAPLGTLFGADDYPAAALRADEEGIVRYRLAIGRDGRVTGCAVTSSSGSVSLDAATCRLVTARARFRPARNAKGKRVADVIHGSIVWRFPDEPEPPAVTPAPPSPQ